MLIRKQITLTCLVETFQEIAALSMVSRSEKSSSWDFDLSTNYLRSQGLKDHIHFASHRANTLPLNSERNIYELNNIVVRNLQIHMDDRSSWDKFKDWNPISFAKLHFEDCRFESSSPNMWPILLPWSGSFRYARNKFCFPSNQIRGTWIFPFKSGSRAWFQENDFSGSSIQTRCIHLTANRDETENTAMTDQGQGRITLVANRGVHELWIQEGYSTIEISGMNRIDRLMVDLTLDVDGAKRTSIYLGPRERIDPSFRNCLQHRSLFLTMRQLAAINHDNRQLIALDRQLEKIEYFLNKGQGAPSLLDCRVWIEYWQDRALYAWRRWSSDFYRSWLRPLVMLVLGYFLINAVPAFFIESFLISQWIDFTLRPITEIPAYEASLVRILGDDYNAVPASTKTLLKLAGFIEVVWIGVWGFALAKSIKR